MSLNWREIDLILKELDLTGSFIQRIEQPDFRTIVFELYRRSGPFSVLVSLETGRTRLHRLTQKMAKPPKRQRFAQLLHSRLKGARIDAVTQVGNDRIVRIDCSRAQAMSTLWIRLWGGAANIIYAEPDGTIIDAFFRRPKRNEVSGAQWNLPEPKPPKEVSIRPHDSERGLSATVEEAYREQESEQHRESLVRAARKQLAKREAALTRRLASLEQHAGGDADTLQHLGELILANLHAIPAGADRVEIEDYAEPGLTRSIELRGGLTAQENAQEYFDRAKKERRRAVTRCEELENIQAQLASIQEQLASIDEIDESELGSIAGERDERTEDRAAAPGLVFERGPFRILVGRNARENDALLRQHAHGNDFWLHTRDFPGGYVFVRAPRGKSVPLETLLDAGNLAVYFSKARANGQAELYYTQVKHLRRAKNAPIGTVLPTQEKNLHITLDDSRLSRLLGRS